MKYLSIFGLILFFIILFLLNTGEVINSLFLIDGRYLFYIFLLCFPLIGFKALRWKIILRRSGINYSLLKSFNLYSMGAAAGIITPGKLGELTKIYFLKKDGHKLVYSLGSIIIDRIFDLIFLSLLCLIGFISLFNIFIYQLLALLILTFFASLLIFVIFKLKLYVFFINRIIPNRFKQVIDEHLANFFQQLKEIGYLNYIFGIILTGASYLFFIWQIYLLGLAINIKLNFFYLLLMISISNFLELLPITFNGIGTREGVYVIFFKIMNLPIEKGFILSLLQLSILIFTALIGLISWVAILFNKKNIKTKNENI